MEDYLRGGKKCPSCGSSQVNDSGFPASENEDTGKAVLSVKCDNLCNRWLWWEIYEVVSLEPVLG